MPRRPAGVLLLAALVLVLPGCETAKQVASDLDNSISRMIGGGAPADDGTACYEPYRVAYYRSLNDAAELESVVSGIGRIGFAALLDSATGGGYANQIERQLVTAFEQTLNDMFTDISNNRDRAQEIRRSFADLTDCRRRTADRIRSDLGAGALGEAEAERRMSELRGLQARNADFEIAVRESREQVAAAPTPQQVERRREQVEEVVEDWASGGLARHITWCGGCVYACFVAEH